MESRTYSRFGAVKRMVAGGLVALALVGGGLVVSSDEAAAYQRTHVSKDGKVIMVCTYSDQTGNLKYCDVYYR